MGDTFRMHVFKDANSENRFVFLSKFSYVLGSAEQPTTPGYDASLWAMCTRGNIEYTDTYIDAPMVDGEIKFPHVRGELISPIFQHGGCTAYYVSGPLFDECKANTQ